MSPLYPSFPLENMDYSWEETILLAPRNHSNPVPTLLQTFNPITVYGHTGNAFDGDDGCVYLDAPLTYHNKVW